jgi:hypothetical protein
MSKQYIVRLTKKERQTLREIVKALKGSSPILFGSIIARALNHAK